MTISCTVLFLLLLIVFVVNAESSCRFKCHEKAFCNKYGKCQCNNARLVGDGVNYCFDCAACDKTEECAPIAQTCVCREGFKRNSNNKCETDLASDDEVRLVEYLFHHKGYNELIRPVANLSQIVKVDLNMAMVQIIHVDEKNQIMKSNVWLRMAWNDYQLKWEKADFGGIEVIRISPSKVWKPDIVLFNNADGNYEVSWMPNILVHANGEILWIPPAIYKSSCTIDVRYFPFDQQECEMKFGSWTFHASQVILGWYEDKNYADLGNYWKSGSWDIIGCPGDIEPKTKQGNLNTTQIVYKIRLRRKTLFYTVNLIIPCVLISFLSVCVFYLPADAGEKMTLCISILLALVVFLLLISKILPPTSISIPLISKYLLFTFIMNIFAIFITVVIINWNYRTPRTHCMPKWVRVVFMQYLPIVLRMNRPDHVISELRTKKQLFEMAQRRDSPGSSAASSKSASPPAFMPARHQDNGRVQSTGSPAVSDRGNHHTGHHPRCIYGGVPTTDVAETLASLDNQLDEAAAEEVANGSADGSRRRRSDAPQTSGRPSKPVRFKGIEITPELREAVASINFISSHLQSEDEFSQVLQDWKYVASVIDKLFLILFGSVTLAGTIGIIANTPYNFDYIDQDEVIRAHGGVI